MKDFSSAIKRIETNHLIANKDYQKLLQHIQFDSFESIWRYQDGETIKNIEGRSVIRFNIEHHIFVVIFIRTAEQVIRISSSFL